jgi:integrase
MDSSALRRGYVAALKRAELRVLRFHDLCHSFGSLAISYGSIVPVQAWMGRADVNTTMRYPHHKRRADDAGLLSHAFRANGDDADGALARRRERALDG